jgi:hypothetical protein
VDLGGKHDDIGAGDSVSAKRKLGQFTNSPRRQIRYLLASAVLLFSGQATQAEVNADTFLKMHRTPEWRKTSEFVIMGNYGGLTWSNAYLASNHRPLIYCQPLNLTLTAPQLIDMLQHKVNEDSDLKNGPVGAVLLQALLEKFPCK